MEAQPKQQEVWQNSTLGQIAVIKLDRRGEPAHEIVNGGQKFNISAEERLLNQDKAAERPLDMFLNGTLVPIRLVEGSEGAEEIANNPNLLGEQELKDLFKLQWKTFEKKVGEIEHPITLKRLLTAAEEVDATVRQVKIINDRLSEVAPPMFIEGRGMPGTGSAPTGERRPKPVTPR